MTRLKMKIMMEGLIATAVEKINVLGWEEAKEDVEKIVDMVEDLEMFWDPDGKLTKTDWSFEIQLAVERARES
jgi:ATP-dependent Zn protease